MRIHAMKWSVCGLMALCLGLLAARVSLSADDDEEKAKKLAAKAAVLSLANGKATLEGLVEWFLTTSNKAPATCNASDLRSGGTAPYCLERKDHDC